MATKCIKQLGTGQRCTRMAAPLSNFCFQHQPDEPPVKVAISFRMDGTPGGKHRKLDAGKATQVKNPAAKKAAPAKKAAQARKPAKKRVT